MTNPFKVSVCFLILIVLTAPASAQQLRDNFRRVKSSVVIVRTGGDESGPFSGQTDDSGVGSGVLISNDGKILTAAHVIQGGQPITIEFTDGQRLKAQVIESSVAADVALLQVDRVPAAATAATLGDSDVVETGDDIFIVGAPYGLSNTLTVGRVSARRPDETRGGILGTREFLQTDAMVNPGNSGSPVFNKAGEVVGIVSSVISETEDFHGVGFAATINTARTLLLDRDPFLVGLDGVLVTGVIARALNIPQPAGFLVTSVARESLAEQMGLSGGVVEATIDNEELLIGGDVVLKINGATINGERRAYRLLFSNIARSNAGGVVRCTVLRAGKIVELSLKIPQSITTSRAARPQ
ncbi:MAG TPA: trypsin-like peptidase domain-containing protein [Pyrinomonadaceae bacterium]